MNGGAVLDRARLARICGLFSSDHPGERANAAAVADRMLRQAGLTWPDVIVRALPPPPPPPPPPDPPPRSQRSIDRDLVDWCASQPDPLTQWERNFLWSIQDNQAGHPSPKQKVIVERVAEKIRAWAAKQWAA